MLGYSFEHQVPWQDWQNTSYFSYRPPGSAACRGGPDSGLSGPALAESPAVQAMTQAIARQYFRLIVLNLTDTVAVDHASSCSCSAGSPPASRRRWRSARTAISA